MFCYHDSIQIKRSVHVSVPINQECQVYENVPKAQLRGHIRNESHQCVKIVHYWLKPGITENYTKIQRMNLDIIITFRKNGLLKKVEELGLVPH